MNKLKIKDIVYSVSETHPFNFEKLYAINTSDVFQGKIINTTMISTDELKGQFKKTIQSNDILFSEIRPINKHFAKVNLTDTKRYVVSTKLMVLRKHNINVDLDYFYYCLTNNVFLKILQSRAENRICSFPQITFDLLGEYSIPIPEMRIQKQIAKTIKNIDSKIEFNNKINDELENMAKTIYDYWFLQFEFPNEEGKPYKSSGGKMVWNDELKIEITEGWINGHLKEYINNQKAGDWGKENAINNYQKEVTCIRGADFSSITSFEKMDMPRRFILEKNSFKLLSVYDLLIEISGGSPIQSTGRICYINDAVLKRFSTKLITSNFCKAISLTDNNYFYWFYMLWKTLYINNVFFNYESKTTGIKNLLFDIMCEKYPICKPPIQIIRLYNQQVTPYFNKIQQNIIENQELTSLRDFLLPLLMNGQVGFKENKAEG